VEQDLGAAFYDITSWSLPLAYNLQAWVVPAPVRGLDGRLAEGAAGPGAGDHAGLGGDGRVGFLAPPAGIAGFRFAADLLREGIGFRVLLDEVEIGGARYPAGTLFVPRLGNEGAGGRRLEEALASLAAAAGVALTGADTSYSSAGISLGSDLAPSIAPPAVGLVSGDGVSPTSFGFLWHLLDQQVRLPHTRLTLDRLGAIELAGYDVLVLPAGWGYEDALDGEAGDALARWVRSGGVLVAVGGAYRWLAVKELTAVEPWKPPAEEGEGGGAAAEPGEGDAVARRPIDTPGAILATRLTPHHPLAAGLPGPPPVLFSGATILLPTGDPQVDVLTAAPGGAGPDRHRLARGRGPPRRRPPGERRKGRPRRGRPVRPGPGLPPLLARHRAALPERRRLRPELPLRRRDLRPGPGPAGSPRSCRGCRGSVRVGRTLSRKVVPWLTASSRWY
jgi:hypothetical protein